MIRTPRLKSEANQKIPPISPENVREKSSDAVNAAREIGFIPDIDVPIRQARKSLRIDVTKAHMHFGRLDFRMILPMDEYSEAVRKLCMTGLPIYHVVNATVGTYIFGGP